MPFTRSLLVKFSLTFLSLWKQMCIHATLPAQQTDIQRKILLSPSSVWSRWFLSVFLIALGA